jgi:hypothetical protein
MVSVACECSADVFTLVTRDSKELAFTALAVGLLFFVTGSIWLAVFRTLLLRRCEASVEQLWYRRSIHLLGLLWCCPGLMIGWLILAVLKG